MRRPLPGQLALFADEAPEPKGPTPTASISREQAREAITRWARARGDGDNPLIEKVVDYYPADPKHVRGVGSIGRCFIHCYPGAIEARNPLHRGRELILRAGPAQEVLFHEREETAAADPVAIPAHRSEPLAEAEARVPDPEPAEDHGLVPPWEADGGDPETGVPEAPAAVWDPADAALASPFPEDPAEALESYFRREVGRLSEGDRESLEYIIGRLPTPPGEIRSGSVARRQVDRWSMSIVIVHEGRREEIWRKPGWVPPPIIKAPPGMGLRERN